MSINFIPNDPLSPAPAMRQLSPRADRPTSQAGFSLPAGLPEEKEYDLTTEPDEFLDWQCREGALAALEMYETVTGAALPSWGRATNPKRLKLIPNAGTDINAFYDGQSLSFFQSIDATQRTLSGMSTDVVAHEAGHGIFDAIRPDLWDSSFFEVGACHEAVGDCVAILTALADEETRKLVLAQIGGKNFVETTAEDLSAAIGRFDPTHNAAEPRHAVNKFKWKFPSRLPTSGGPGELIQEVHSFAMVFSGCFYDTLLAIFKKEKKDADGLLAAVKIAGKILFAGLAAAVETPQFFRAVGQAMTLADEQLFAGANRVEIRAGFKKHNIMLGSNSVLAPTMALEGSAPKLLATKATLAASTLKDLRDRISLPKGGKLIVDLLHIAGEKVAQAIHRRAIDLGGIDKRLKGVVAMAAEATVVGSSDGVPAILGALPNIANIAEEVLLFVESLLRSGMLAFDKGVKSAVSGKQALPTHVIQTKGQTKTLQRVRFACGCTGRLRCQ